jgi:tellurite resistance-related uncharacterized protein
MQPMNREGNTEIRQWLDSKEKDYQAGLSLFLKYSNNKALQRYLSRRTAQMKLEYELDKLSKLITMKTTGLPPQKVIRNEMPPEEKEDKQAVISKHIKFEDMPEVLQEYYLKNVDEHKKMRALHEKMKLAETDEERASLRQDLVALDTAVAERWDVIDKWTETGVVPEVKPKKKTVTDSETLTIQDVGALRATVSRALSSLESTDVQEDKRKTLTEKLEQAAKNLVGSGQNLLNETMNRIRKFVPNFGTQESKDG